MTFGKRHKNRKQLRASEPGIKRHRLRQLDRQILALALPSLVALLAEPLMVLADSAMVGHLGKVPLAGLSLGSTITATVIYLFIFLAYTTTTSASRALGSGDKSGALKCGLDGVWFAVALGALIAPLTWWLAPYIVSLFHPTAAVSVAAISYVRAAAPGVGAMFVVLAATGALRGLLDTRTPMIVSVLGSVFNVAANAALIYGMNLGITGSGLGTSLSQSLMMLTLLVLLVRAAQHEGVSLKPSLSGARVVGLAGTPLLVRTVNLRAAILLTTWAATGIGETALAGHQIVNSIWGLGAYAMDALAIASQALVGHALGAQDRPKISATLRRCILWGWWIGAILGIVFVGSAAFVPALFTADAAVQAAATSALVVAGIAQPLAGYVFIMDGVLMGADKNRFLALASIINLAVYAPFVIYLALSAVDRGQRLGLTLLWIFLTFVFTAARAVTNKIGARDLLT